MLGWPFFTHCTKANITDDQGLIEMLTINIDYFKSKPAELHHQKQNKKNEENQDLHHLKSDD